jgi:RNA polymerase sigma-70 factor (ECF subfamily)
MSVRYPRAACDESGRRALDTVMPPTDAQLLASDAPDAFVEVCRRHGPALRSFLRHRTRDGEIAADLLAETFAAAWAVRRRFKDERDGSAGPWLYTIARNQAAMHARRGSLARSARERIGMTVRDYGAAAYDEAEERIDSELLAPHLGRALADLSPSERRAIELRVVGEHSYDEIGERLAITPAAARTRVYRALSALRASLKGS